MTQINRWGVFGRILLFCIISAVILAIASGVTKPFDKPWNDIVSLGIAIAITICFSILFVRWEKTRLKDIGLVPGRDTYLRILFGLMTGLVMSGLQPLMLFLFSDHFRLVFSGKLNLIAVITAFLLYSLIAVREEIAFRAYPLRTLNKTFGPWIALSVVFVVFSLEHILGGMNWMQAFLGAGFGSILFGITALYTKGIALPVGLHIAWNFGQWLFGFKNNTGVWVAVVDKGYEKQVETMGLISYLIIIVLAILAFYFYWHKKGLSV